MWLANRIEQREMTAKSFIVNLVSNASMGLYSNNRISSFTTQLPGNGIQLPLQLDDDVISENKRKGFWEVALLDISFPTKFKNVIVGAYTITSKRLKGAKLHNVITAGVYRSVDEIFAEINKQIRLLHFTDFGDDIDSFTFFSYRYDPVSSRLEIKIRETEGQLILSSADLRGILGYDYETGVNGIKHIEPSPPPPPPPNIDAPTAAATAEQGWVRAEYAPDIQRLHQMMVYTDIIEHQIIGDTLAPLLRSIPLKSKTKNGELSGMDYTQSHESFHEPLQFKKIQVNTFHAIHIDLYAENGERIPFIDVGHAALTLMFRYNAYT